MSHLSNEAVQRNIKTRQTNEYLPYLNSCYLNYPVDRVRCRNRRAVGQAAALFHRSEFRYPWDRKKTIYRIRLYAIIYSYNICNTPRVNEKADHHVPISINNTSCRLLLHQLRSIFGLHFRML